MPNTKEKLIELLVDSPGLDTLYGKEEEFEENAEWLIAHSVTVQEWISVKDRLPEEFGFYLTARKRDVFVEQWNGVCFSQRCHHAQPTHWMPLPQPPKGE